MRTSVALDVAVVKRADEESLYRPTRPTAGSRRAGAYGEPGSRPGDCWRFSGSVWLAPTNSGHLELVKADGTCYDPIARYRVADRGTDAYLVYLGNRISINDDATLRYFRIASDEAK